MNTETPAFANPSKLPSEVAYMTKNNSKFNPKPTNEPSEEQYMTNKNANETLMLLRSNRDNIAENSGEKDKNSFKINSLGEIRLTWCKLNHLFFSFMGFSLHEKGL